MLYCWIVYLHLGFICILYDRHTSLPDTLLPKLDFIVCLSEEVGVFLTLVCLLPQEVFCLNPAGNLFVWLYYLFSCVYTKRFVMLFQEVLGK